MLLTFRIWIFVIALLENTKFHSHNWLAIQVIRDGGGGIGLLESSLPLNKNKI